MDVLHLIKDDNDALRTQLDALVASQGASVKTAFAAVARALRVRLKLNQEYLYPEVQGLFQGSDVVVEVCLANDVVICRHLDDAEKALAKGGVEAKLVKLRDLVVKQFELGEQMLMPKLRQAIATQDREDLGQVILDAREEIEAGVDSREPQENQAASSGRRASVAKAKTPAARVVKKRRA